MYNQGKSWDGNAKKWTGDFSALAMSDYDLGQVVIKKNDDGTYERFAINAVVLRDPDSYKSTRKNPDDPNYKDYQSLDYMFLYKKDLNGKILDFKMVDGWQTVANGYEADYIPKGKNNKPAKPWTTNGKQPYRGSTVKTNQNFGILFGNFTSDDYDGNIMVINSFTMQSGKQTGVGKSSSGGRTLIHSINTANSDGVLTYWDGGSISAGCFMNDAEKIINMQNMVNNWGLSGYVPYNVKTYIRDMTQYETRCIKHLKQ